MDAIADWKKTCPLDYDQVTKAVTALKEYLSKTNDKKDKKGLLEEHNVIQVQILVHKIPAVKNKETYIDLPHSLFPEGTDVCLITRDTGGDNTDKTIEKYQKLFKKFGVAGITKIMPLKELRSDYGSYEGRRRLLSMYDLFLCEDAICHRLPNLLGKTFYQIKKNPWPVTMHGKYMKDEAYRVLNQTRWTLSGSGSCSLVTAARTNFSVEHIVDNVMAAAVGIARFMPRGWNNVRSLHIRTDNSMALPVYYNDCPVDVNDLDFTELSFLKRQKQISASKKRLLNLIGSKKVSKRRPKFGHEVTGRDQTSSRKRKLVTEGDDL